MTVDADCRLLDIWNRGQFENLNDTYIPVIIKHSVYIVLSNCKFNRFVCVEGYESYYDNDNLHTATL